MVALHKYYQHEQDDHLYTTATEEIGINLQIGEYGDDNYEYQGVECYVYSSPGDIIKGHETDDIYGGLRQLPQDLDEQLNSEETNGDYKFVLISFTTKSITKNWTVYAFMGLFMFVTIVSVIAFLLCHGRNQNTVNGYSYQEGENGHECLI